ncbi:MAG: nickel-dependent lactate racemase [Anaerolineae bacterium]|nr:nickel-dependent lactate racemase [Anaerolineae bacterium]
MDSVAITLPGSGMKYQFRVPARNLGEVLSPAAVPAPADSQTLVKRALTEPVGCVPLAEMIKPGQRLLIVVDDITRTTPTRELIPVLLDYLAELGCRAENITFGLALGAHRPMTEAEIEWKLGRDVARRFPVINTPAQHQDVFVDTQQSWAGVPIEVHRAVIEADIVIGVGSVVPHADVGWSGGAKIILPGMCSERTVNENHFLAAAFPENMLGRETTPIRENMEAVVELIGLDYILNVVMTPAGDITAVMGGHFVAAQRAAVRAARAIFSVPFKERYEIVVANAYPKDIDFWQSSMAVWAGELMVKPGGVIILNAPCREGVGPHPEFLWLMGLKAEEVIDAVNSGQLTDKSMAAEVLQMARMLQHMRLTLVTTGLNEVEVRDVGFGYFASLQEAVDAHLAEAGPEARIGVLTHGGYTYPIQISPNVPSDFDYANKEKASI